MVPVEVKVVMAVGENPDGKLLIVDHVRPSLETASDPAELLPRAYVKLEPPDGLLIKFTN